MIFAHRNVLQTNHSFRILQYFQQKIITVGGTDVLAGQFGAPECDNYIDMHISILVKALSSLSLMSH